MKTQGEIQQRLDDVDRQIRETAEAERDGSTAYGREWWDKLHKESETLRWVLGVPTEGVKTMPKCPRCGSEHIDTTLNYNGTDPNRNNCRCLNCEHEFNHQWERGK